MYLLEIDKGFIRWQIVLEVMSSKKQRIGSVSQFMKDLTNPSWNLPPKLLSYAEKEKMKNLCDVDYKALRWKKSTSSKVDYELFSGKNLCSSLILDRYDVSALAISLDDIWVLNWNGLHAVKISIHSIKNKKRVARFKQPWTKGALEFKNGRRVLWESMRINYKEAVAKNEEEFGWPKSANKFRENRYVFKNTDSSPIISFEPIFELASDRYSFLQEDVDIEDTAISMPELPLLATLGLYLVLIYTVPILGIPVG